MSGISYDAAYTLDLDQEDNVFVTGYFSDTADFNPSVGVHYAYAPYANPAVPVPPTDIFLTKQDSLGNLVWMRQFGGTGFDGAISQTFPPSPTVGKGGGLSIDDNGNVFVCGTFYSDTIDIDPGLGVDLRLNHNQSSTRSDYMVVKLDNDGQFIWGHTLGGLGDEMVDQCRADPFGNVIMVGTFRDTVDFDPDPQSVNNLISNSSADIFIQKLDPSGNLIWVGQVSGEGEETPADLQIDGQGNIYLCGSFEDTVDFDPGPGLFEVTAMHSEQSPTPRGTFLLKISGSGEMLDFFQVPNGWEGNDESSLSIDISDNVIFSGSFDDTVDVDPSGSELLIAHPELGRGGFIVKISPQFELIWARELSVLQSIATDENQAVYGILTITETTDVDPGPGMVALGTDGLALIKINNSADLVWAAAISNQPVNGLLTEKAITIGQNTGVFFTGSFEGYLDFDPLENQSFLLESYTWFKPDIYVAKWSQIDTTVDVTEKEELNEISVYPNPVSQTVFIEREAQTGSNAILKVIDTSGRLVIPYTKISSKTAIDVESWHDGVYLISVTDGQTVHTRKILKY
ncbi:MAG: T9SS type A sorting domain-containing protein [Flavobacteriales bacterium]|nr:T9SS type A sorting domain-containing protein [Flavobacteriales bacterium]